MSDRHIPTLRRRFLEDMRIKGVQPRAQTMYMPAKRDFTRFLGRSPDTATPEHLRAFQLDMSEKGIGSATFNNRLSVLGFFLSVTCARPKMKPHMRYQRVAKKIPVVPSAEAVTNVSRAPLSGDPRPQTGPPRAPCVARSMPGGPLSTSPHGSGGRLR